MEDDILEMSSILQKPIKMYCVKSQNVSRLNSNSNVKMQFIHHAGPLFGIPIDLFKIIEQESLYTDQVLTRGSPIYFGQKTKQY